MWLMAGAEELRLRLPPLVRLVTAHALDAGRREDIILAIHFVYISMSDHMLHATLTATSLMMLTRRASTSRSRHYKRCD